jgi:hypothetical protein
MYATTVTSEQPQASSLLALWLRSSVITLHTTVHMACVHGGRWCVPSMWGRGTQPNRRMQMAGAELSVTMQSCQCGCGRQGHGEGSAPMHGFKQPSRPCSPEHAHKGSQAEISSGVCPGSSSSTARPIYTQSEDQADVVSSRPQVTRALTLVDGVPRLGAPPRGRVVWCFSTSWCTMFLFETLCFIFSPQGGA